MWIVKIDDKLWLTKDGTTEKESEAYRFPSMPAVQAHLKKIKRYIPHREAMVIAAVDDL